MEPDSMADKVHRENLRRRHTSLAADFHNRYVESAIDANVVLDEWDSDVLWNAAQSAAAEIVFKNESDRRKDSNDRFKPKNP